MAEKAKALAIRFKGFSDALKQYKVDEIATDVKRSIDMKDDEVYQLVTVKRRNEGVISRGFLKGKDILVKNYFEIRAGDYIISKRQVIHGANGLVPESLDKSVVSNEYLIIVSNDFISTKFWTLISQRYKMYKMFFLSSYGVDVEKMVFNVEDWKKRSIIIPDVAEQNRIVEFFDKLDHLITLHQRKLEKLQNVKKAMLVKMFPKNGSSVPEIRFAGFTDAWEQRKLSDLASMKARIGWQGLKKEEFLDEGDYYLITGTDFSEGRIDLKNCHFIDQERYNQDPNIQIKNGDVLITKDGTIGKVAYVSNLNKPATLNAGVFVVKGKHKSISNLYLYHYLAAPYLLQFADQQATGGTIKHLNQNVLVNFPVPLPKVEEQKKIGQILLYIDKLVTLYQRKLEKLQNVKKACLEEMFV